MHKLMKLLVCAAAVAILQTGAFAAVNGSVSPNANAASPNAATTSPASPDATLNANAENSPGENVGGDTLRREGEGVVSGITPYTNDIPNTGTENLAIPGIVAMLAAATAAIALSGKKK